MTKKKQYPKPEVRRKVKRKKKKLSKKEKQIVTQSLAKFEPANAVKLGALSFNSPDAQVVFVKDLAARLSVIIRENNWFQPYEDKDYVRVEGWTMLGSLIGVTPVEEFVREITLSTEDLTVKGYEAKINLLCNGQIIGGASSECTVDEAMWAGKDKFALRSMTLTRATSKALRLNYGWIVGLAGYQTTPFDEIPNPEKKIVLDKPAQEKPAATAKTNGTYFSKLFVFWPDSHNGNKGFLYGQPLHTPEAIKLGLDAYIQQEFHGVFTDKFNPKGGWLIPHDKVDAAKTYLESKGMPVQVLENKWATTTPSTGC